MQVVVDSDSMNHVVRSSKKSGPHFVTCLDGPIKDGRLTIALDVASGLQSEWAKPCGIELIKRLVIKWEDLNGIVWITNLQSLGGAAVKQLKSLGFKDKTIDKLILRLARETNDHIVVSEDSDFWDPKDTNSPGHENAPVARYCKRSLDIEIILLKSLLGRLRKSNAAGSP